MTCNHDTLTVQFATDAPGAGSHRYIDLRVRCARCKEVLHFHDEVLFRDNKTQCRLVVELDQTRRIILPGRN